MRAALEETETRIRKNPRTTAVVGAYGGFGLLGWFCFFCTGLLALALLLAGVIMLAILLSRNWTINNGFAPVIQVNASLPAIQVNTTCCIESGSFELAFYPYLFTSEKKAAKSDISVTMPLFLMPVLWFKTGRQITLQFANMNVTDFFCVYSWFFADMSAVPANLLPEMSDLDGDSSSGISSQMIKGCETFFAPPKIQDVFMEMVNRGDELRMELSYNNQCCFDSNGNILPEMKKKLSLESEGTLTSSMTMSYITK
jgi:hypothetical protein